MAQTPPKRKFNPKYHVLAEKDYLSRYVQFEEMADEVVYTGNPKHKMNPGDFRLDPPDDPRPLASLCDNARIFHRYEAQRSLEDAFRFGLVDCRCKEGDWPRIVWMVSESGMVLQGMFENIPGRYHGFPVLEKEDPVRNEVLRIWKSRK